MMLSFPVIKLFLFAEAAFTAFLVTVLIAIRPYFRTQGFFCRWTWAWIAHVASLALGLWLMSMDRGTAPFKSFCLLASIILALLFAPLLVAGVEAFSNSGKDAVVARTGTIAALAAALVIYMISMLVGNDTSLAFEVRTIPEELAASAALGYCSYVFLRYWRRTGSSGSLLAMLSCGIYGITRTLYTILTVGGSVSSVRWVAIDILCQGGIAIATLLVILEYQASAVSTALEELRKSEQRYLFEASRDSLVRLWNRKAIFDLLSSEISRANRSHTPLVVFLIDLDHFKQVNDNYGHLVGDDALRGVASRITKSVREYDHVGRYGGEEFIVVLPECSAEMAIEIAERIRQGITQEPIVNAPVPVNITASFGVSQWCPGQDLRDLLQEADLALYAAKHNGRNRVEVGNISGQVDKDYQRYAFGRFRHSH